VTPVFLCRIEELADPGTKNVVLGEGEDELDIIIVQTRGTRHAYINCCPHQFIPLETFPNHFLTADKTQMVCSGHGARFALATGECLSGPCLGKALGRLSIEENNGAIYLADPREVSQIARDSRMQWRW
jgi:nitrite reductase/ring-hydroxylating ferredoxin subunit